MQTVCEVGQEGVGKQIMIDGLKDRRMWPIAIIVSSINFFLIFWWPGMGLLIGLIITVIVITLAERAFAEQDDAVRQAKKDQLLDLMLTKELKRKGVK